MQNKRPPSQRVMGLNRREKIEIKRKGKKKGERDTFNIHDYYTLLYIFSK